MRCQDTASHFLFEKQTIIVFLHSQHHAQSPWHPPCRRHGSSARVYDACANYPAPMARPSDSSRLPPQLVKSFNNLRHLHPPPHHPQTMLRSRPRIPLKPSQIICRNGEPWTLRLSRIRSKSAVCCEESTCSQLDLAVVALCSADPPCRKPPKSHSNSFHTNASRRRERSCRRTGSRRSRTSRCSK